MAIVNAYGQALAEYEYDPYGNIVSQSGPLADVNPLRYRGYVYDSETQFYYLQSRYYDPELGRFLNADSYASTGQGIIGNNMFAYCLNNPVCRIDVTGMAAADYKNDDGELLSNDDIERRDGGGSPTVIYRYGGVNKGNLVPKTKDINDPEGRGLSFSTEYRSGSATTTIEQVNETGVLYAVQDGMYHVSIYPVNATMYDWYCAGRDSVWTNTLRGIEEKAK